jgi:hypothetical protein
MVRRAQKRWKSERSFDKPPEHVIAGTTDLVF